jgi:hypothetical protein
METVMHFDNVNIQVEVKVSDLISALKKNKEKHILDYKEAVDLYHIKVRERLEELVKSNQNNEIRKDNYAVHMIAPVDASKKYDEYISMLSMSQSETMNLGTHEYKCFVEDQWDWAIAATLSNSTYKMRM